jgi:hypothetical protein
VVGFAVVVVVLEDMLALRFLTAVLVHDPVCKVYKEVLTDVTLLPRLSVNGSPSPPRCYPIFCTPPAKFAPGWR